MKWQKYTWEDGDLITTQKLNHIEYGIDRVESSSGGQAGAKSLMVREKYDLELEEAYLDIDADKLIQAIKSGVSVMIIPSNGGVSHMTTFYENISENSLTDNQIYSAEIQFFNGIRFFYGFRSSHVSYSRFTSVSIGPTDPDR